MQLRTTVGMAILAGILLSGCVSSVNQAALEGDLPTLKREVERSQKRKRLSQARVERLAWSVAGRELRSAKGDLGVHRVSSMRPCAGHLGRVLRDRAERLDEAGAEAAMLLLETNQLRPAPLLERYRDAESSAWRAVAARATVASEHHLLRREFLLDPDLRVRQAALRAALQRPSSDDLDSLLEAARLDPDPLVRAMALRAVGGIGGERAVLALMDRWPGAAEEERIAIVDAWASPASYGAGGQERLVNIVETTRGMPAIAAAGSLSRDPDPKYSAMGTAILTRILKNGSTKERRVAMLEVPLGDKDALKAIEDAAGEDKDREVKVMALARLYAARPLEKKELLSLRDLAKGEDRVAYQAQAALATAGDQWVLDRLKKELKAPRSFRRLLAAEGLLAMGRYSDAATALADDDPRVRATFACSVLAEAELPLH